MDMESDEPPANSQKMQRMIDVFKGTVIINFNGKIVTHPNIKMEHMQNVSAEKCYGVHPEIGRLWIGLSNESTKAATTLVEKYKGPLKCSIIEVEFPRDQSITTDHRRLFTEQLKASEFIRLTMGSVALASLMANPNVIDMPQVTPLWKVICKVRHLWTGSEQDMFSFLLNRNASNNYKVYFEFPLPETWSSFVQHLIQNFLSHSNPASIVQDITFSDPRCVPFIVNGREYLKQEGIIFRYCKVIGYPSYDEYQVARDDHWSLFIAYYEDGAINFEITKKEPCEDKNDEQHSNSNSSEDSEDPMLAGPKEEEESDEHKSPNANAENNASIPSTS